MATRTAQRAITMPTVIRVRPVEVWLRSTSVTRSLLSRVSATPGPLLPLALRLLLHALAVLEDKALLAFLRLCRFRLQRRRGRGGREGLVVADRAADPVARHHPEVVGGRRRQVGDGRADRQGGAPRPR